MIRIPGFKEIASAAQKEYDNEITDLQNNHEVIMKFWEEIQPSFAEIINIRNILQSIAFRQQNIIPRLLQQISRTINVSSNGPETKKIVLEKIEEKMDLLGNIKLEISETAKKS